MSKISKTDGQWQAQLSPEQYRVTRKSGTERPGTHPLNNEKRDGIYKCVCCGEPLFEADAKYESGSGWPSFFQPMSAGSIEERADNSLFRKRTEIRCNKCEAHLGHVFDDGPQPTGMRYCMNGAALTFEPNS